RVLLNVARHECIAPAAHRNVKRRAGPTRVSERSAETQFLNHPFSLRSVFNAKLRQSPPHPVAMRFELFNRERIHQSDEAVSIFSRSAAALEARFRRRTRRITTPPTITTTSAAAPMPPTQRSSKCQL